MRKLVLLSVPMLFGLMACGAGTPPDTTAPVVVSQVPAASATNIYLVDEISVTFSEPMAASSVNATNAQLKIGSVVTPSTATLDASGTKLVLIPTGLPALPGTVSVSLTGLTDKAGNVLATFNSSFAAPDWQQPGIQPLDINLAKSADISSRSLVLDSSGKPVVAWTESDGTSYNIYVKRWDGTAWQQVGATFLDANPDQNAREPAIALDSSGKPVVAWTETDGTSNNIYVKRWDGTAWQQVGATFLDANTNQNAFSPSMALDSSGKPVVAWRESDGTSTNVYVKRLNRIP